MDKEFRQVGMNLRSKTEQAGAGAFPPKTSTRAAWWRLMGLGLVLLFVLAACSETAKISAESKCRTALDEAIDQAGWTEAVNVCGKITGNNDELTDVGRSLQSQAFMGRAGVTLVDLLGQLSGDNASNGLALMLDLFAINLTTELQRFTDVQAAVGLMNGLSCFTDAAVACDDTDTFNIMIASDVVLTSMFVNSLGMLYCDQTKVDTGSCAAADVDTVIIPGITNAGLETLTDPTDFAAIITVLNALYTTTPSYYTTAPLVWSNPAIPVDLARLSAAVQANWKGASSLGIGTDPALASLEALAFGISIDNGQCGYAAGVNLAAPVTDPTVAVKNYPRKLDISSEIILADNLKYVMLDAALVADATTEWGGEFLLPSALVNPANLASPGTSCGGACTNFPTLATHSVANGVTAKADLAAVLDQVYPIDNAADPAASTFNAATGVPCVKGDGWVHVREYDYYLRNIEL